MLGQQRAHSNLQTGWWFVSRSFLGRLKQGIHCPLGPLHSAAITFRASSAVTVQFALPSARFTPFWLAHPGLLIEILLADRECKHLAAVRAPNLLVFHLEPRVYPLTQK